MKRLILATFIFIIGCIIIGVIKQEYLIHRLLELSSFESAEVSLYRFFSYSSYTINIAVVIAVTFIISLLLFFVLMLIEGEKFCFLQTHKAFLYATSWLFICLLFIEIAKFITLLYSDISFLALFETDKETYELCSKALTIRNMRCDLIGGFIGLSIFFVSLHRKLPLLPVWKLLPNVIIYLFIFIFFFYKQLTTI